jgi:hypothetical protein
VTFGAGAAEAAITTATHGLFQRTESFLLFKGSSLLLQTIQKAITYVKPVTESFRRVNVYCFGKTGSKSLSYSRYSMSPRLDSKKFERVSSPLQTPQIELTERSARVSLASGRFRPQQSPDAHQASPFVVRNPLMQARTSSRVTNQRVQPRSAVVLDVTPVNPWRAVAALPGATEP